MRGFKSPHCKPHYVVSLRNRMTFPKMLPYSRYSDIQRNRLLGRFSIASTGTRWQGSTILRAEEECPTSVFIQLFTYRFKVKYDMIREDTSSQWYPFMEKTLLSSVPPSNFLISVSDPWRAFWADRTPFKGPQFSISGTTEIWGEVWGVGQVAPRTVKTQEQLTQPLLVQLLKTHFH